MLELTKLDKVQDDQDDAHEASLNHRNVKLSVPGSVQKTHDVNTNDKAIREDEMHNGKDDNLPLEDSRVLKLSFEAIEPKKVGIMKSQDLKGEDG